MAHFSVLIAFTNTLPLTSESGCTYIGAMYFVAMAHTTIVVYSKVHEVVCVAHKITSPKNQLKFFQTMVGSIGYIKLSPNKLSVNAFKRLLQKFKFFFTGIFY